MKLDPAGREYAKWTVGNALPGMVFEVSFNDGAYNTATLNGTTISLLVAGPQATGNPGGTVVLALGSNRAKWRVQDTPEIVIRGGGNISVVAV